MTVRPSDLALTTAPKDDAVVMIDHPSSPNASNALAVASLVGGVRVGTADSGGLTRGQVVRIKSTAGSGGTTPTFTKAIASATEVLTDALYVVLADAAGGAQVSVASRLLFTGLTPAGSPAVGDAVYVTDAASISGTPGTYTRQVGRVTYTDGATTWTVAFDGLSGGGGGGGGGGVSSVGGTAPIASSGGTNPVISIVPATSSVPGSMSAADKAKLDAIDPTLIPSSGQKSALAGTSGTPGSGNKYVTDADSRLSDSRDAISLRGVALASGAPVSGRFLKYNGTNWDDTAVTLQDGYLGGATITPTNAGGQLSVDASGAGANALDAALYLLVDGTVQKAALLLRAVGSGFIARIKGVAHTVTGFGGVTVALEGGDGGASDVGGSVRIDGGKDNGGGSGKIEIGLHEASDIKVGVLGGDSDHVIQVNQPVVVGDGPGGGGMAWAAELVMSVVSATFDLGPLPDVAAIFAHARADGDVTLVLQRSSGAFQEIEVKAHAVRAVSSSTTIAADDEVLHVDSSGGPVALTAAALDKRRRVIKKVGTGTNPITIVRTGSEKIEGTAATYTLPGSAMAPSLTQPLAWQLYDDGTDRFIL